jgi:signal transduction histidine kinase
LNLLINSAQAIESKGKITITANSSTDEVIIEIADTGKGIPDDIQSQVFNPFFTTKPVGTGTGLGLSIAYKIVTGLHHGSINFSSKIGTGTIFKISLPTKVK